MSESFVFYRSFRDALSFAPDDKYRDCIEALLSYALDGVYEEDNGIVSMFMTLVRPQIDAAQRRRKNGEKGAEYGRLGGRPKKENPIGVTEENPIGVTSETPNVNVNVNANVKRSVFIPPTVEEVRAYCQERGNNVDPEKFVDFYESKGWMIGKNKMKDYKAAIRHWERDEKKKAPKTYQFKQRSYDFNDLERRILQR